MSLRFLDFDFHDGHDGRGTFDAIATVSAAQWPALAAEVEAVLAWAHRTFPGECGPLEVGGTWDCDLQGQRELPQALHLDYDPAARALRLQDGPPGEPRLTLTFTLSGAPAFCEALREAFGLD